MKLIQWTAPVVCLLCVSGVSAEEQSNASSSKAETPAVELKYQFSEGEEWHYSLTEKGTQTAISPGLTRSARNNSSQTKHYRVVRVDEDGSAIIEVVLDRYRIDFTVKNTPDSGKSQETRLAYDTADDEAAPRGLTGIKTSIGKPFARFRMSPAGNITELKFLQSTQPEALEKAEQTKGLPIAFPTGPISIGKSWSEKVAVELQPNPQDNPDLKQSYKVQTIYQLKAVADGVAEISLSTIVQPRLSNPLLRGQMMSYLPTGTILFDISQGRIISRTELIDRQEVGVAGPKTALTIENRKVESLIAPDRQGLAN